MKTLSAGGPATGFLLLVTQYSLCTVVACELLLLVKKNLAAG